LRMARNYGEPDVAIEKDIGCHAALKSQNHACLFSILFRDLSPLSLH
jgi:hypothetical protein